jgi:hypothetical protein
MRPTIIALLALSSLLAAEDAEVFRLADGRRLVGTYDAERQQIQLAGPIAAGIRVAPGQIVERRPATAADIPAAAPPADPATALATRIAWLRTAIRGLDATAQERATQRGSIERRLADDRADLAQSEARAKLVADAITAQAEERQRIQAMADEVAQQRALTDTRLQALSVEQGARSSAVYTEITTELSRADQRLAELRLRLRDADALLQQQRRVLADAQADSAQAAHAITEGMARLARYDQAEAQTRAERERLATVLAGLQPEAADGQPAR